MESLLTKLQHSVVWPVLHSKTTSPTHHQSWCWKCIPSCCCWHYVVMMRVCRDLRPTGIRNGTDPCVCISPRRGQPSCQDGRPRTSWLWCHYRVSESHKPICVLSPYVFLWWQRQLPRCLPRCSRFMSHRLTSATEHLFLVTGNLIKSSVWKGLFFLSTHSGSYM